MKRQAKSGQQDELRVLKGMLSEYKKKPPEKPGGW
jgi:hypothetical protein